MTPQMPDSVSTFRHGLGNLLRSFRAGRLAPVIFGQKNRAEFVLMGSESFDLLMDKATRAYDAAAMPTLLDRLSHPRGPENSTASTLAAWLDAPADSVPVQDEQVAFWPSVYDDARELTRSMSADERRFFLRSVFSHELGETVLDDERLGSRRLKRVTVPPLRPGSHAVLVYVEHEDERGRIVAMVIPDASFSGMLARDPLDDGADGATPHHEEEG